MELAVGVAGQAARGPGRPAVHDDRVERIVRREGARERDPELRESGLRTTSS